MELVAAAAWAVLLVGQWHAQNAPIMHTAIIRVETWVEYHGMYRNNGAQAGSSLLEYDQRFIRSLDQSIYN